MFVAPGTAVGQRLTRAVAEGLASNWWRLLLNGIVLVIAGFLIFSINWTIRELATFIGALFIFQGVAHALTTGIDARVPSSLPPLSTRPWSSCEGIWHGRTRSS